MIKRENDKTEGKEKNLTTSQNCSDNVLKCHKNI